MADSAKQTCAHEGCSSELPADEHKIPPGWSVARVQSYGKKSIVTAYYYVCPLHELVTVEKQQSLFQRGQNQPERSEQTRDNTRGDSPT